MATSVRAAFRVPAALDLAAIDPRGRPVGPRDKDAAATAMAKLAPRLDELQERLYAEATKSPVGRCCSCSRAWTPRARAG